MNKYFQYIISWLEDHNRDILSILRKGLTAEEIINALKGQRLCVPKEVLELYMICDGINSKEGDILDDLHLFPGFYFVPLLEAIDHYVSFKDDQRWNHHWLPIFANGGGDFFVVDCEKDSKISPVIGFMLGRDDNEVEFLSITHMFKTIAEWCKQDAIFIDEENYLEFNLIWKIQIANEINPGIDRWEKSLRQLLY